MTKVLYPGSFDPITKGHMNIIMQASKMFDEVIVAIMINPAKKNFMFSLEERLEIINKLYNNTPNVMVVIDSGSSVDAAIKYGASAIVRGLRSLSDFDYEVQLQQVNKDISNGMVNTVCLFADKEYQFISSSMVKQVYELGKDISRYVDQEVYEHMRKRRKEQ